MKSCVGIGLPSVGHFEVGHDFSFVLGLAGDLEVEDNSIDLT